MVKNRSIGLINSSNAYAVRVLLAQMLEIGLRTGMISGIIQSRQNGKDERMHSFQGIKVGGCIMLKDADMRIILLNELKKVNEQHDYRIIEEMAVCDGEARVDVAVANGRLCGYEIKSDADTLDRLAIQKKCYDKTFDKVSIVVGEKFKDKIEEHVPEYWGIYVVSESSRGCKIRRMRPARLNRNIEVDSLLELLWRDEIVILLK